MKMISKKIITIVFFVLLSFNSHGQFFKENFDASAQIPSNWVVTDNGVGPTKTLVINTTSTFSHSQVNSVEMQSGDNANGEIFEDWLISPAINISTLSKPEFHFWARNKLSGNQNSKIQLRISNVSQDRATFTTVLGEWNEFYTGASNPISTAYNTWAEKTIDLSPFISSSQIYVAFVIINTGSGDGWFLDDMSIVDSPANLTAVQVTGTTATITWDNVPGNPIQYDIELRKGNEAFTGLRTHYVNTTPLNQRALGPLNFNTEYKYRVKALYNGITSNWSDPFSFLTSCFSETFEMRGLTITSPWQSIDRNGIGILQKWTISSTVNAHNSSRCAWLSSEAASDTPIEDWLITPSINLTCFTNPELHFWAKSKYGANNNSKIGVLLSTSSGTDYSTFTTLSEWTDFYTGATNPITPVLDTYAEKTIDLSSYAEASQAYMAFVVTTSGSGDTWGLDNISIVDKPHQLTASNITNTSATLSWTAASHVTQFEIELLENSQNPTGNPTTTVSTNTYNATGLNQGTQYKYYVRSVYTTAKSTWSGPFTFTPDAVDYSCPNGDTNFPTPPPNWARFRTVVVGAPNTYHNILATPLVPIPVNGQFRFYPRSGAVYGSIINKYQVRIASGALSTNQTNEATYTTLVQEWTPAQFNISGEMVVAIPSQFWGQTVYIALICEYTNNEILPDSHVNSSADDVRIVQECLAPTNLTATNITPDSATLSWGNPGNAVSFEIENMLATATPTGIATGTSTTNSYQQTGLANLTNYKYYVRAICESCAENNSDWIGPYNYIAREPSCTIDNPNSQVVKNLFMKLVDHLLEKHFSSNPIPAGGYWPQELLDLAPYITDENPGIYDVYYSPTSEEFSFSFTEHGEAFTRDVIISEVNQYDQQNYGLLSDVDIESFISSEVYLDYVSVLTDGNPSEISYKAWIKHINFCPDEIVSCTVNNPKSQVVNNLFIELLNHLHHRSIQDLPIPLTGYTCQELDNLKPYITDINPKIYNYSYENETMKFWFHPPSSEDFRIPDVFLQKWDHEVSSIASINLQHFSNPNIATDLGNLIVVSSGYLIQNATVRHINFCPDEDCVNHVAIVVDESGSLDETEKIKIKRQLRKFVDQQRIFNNQTLGEMHLSLIGMSDSDSNLRPNNGGPFGNILQKKITDITIGEFNAWIDSYGNRYGQSGISEGSDFWKSGLDVALASTMKPDIVIMITDGAQTANPTMLKATMQGFNNHSMHNLPVDPTKPHLYVIGTDDGFYVNNEENTNNGLQRNQDPNYVANLTSVTPTARVTSSLKLSLKFLLGLDAVFPTASTALPNFATDDYIGLPDFSVLGEDETFLSDNIKRANIGCGKIAIKNPCDDCFSFQPEPGKWYVLNAWAKEELNVQVIKYENPQIKLIFKDGNKEVITPQQPNANIFKTKGDIIEGWQRIGDKFQVPDNAVFMEIELINESANVPVFFDDIRIYPIKGSMKSFVYDAETFKLMSELDENNYATYYEYDNEGGLVRIKKETVEGIKTIQETRSGNFIKNIEE